MTMRNLVQEAAGAYDTPDVDWTRHILDPKSAYRLPTSVRRAIPTQNLQRGLFARYGLAAPSMRGGATAQDPYGAPSFSQFLGSRYGGGSPYRPEIPVGHRPALAASEAGLLQRAREAGRIAGMTETDFSARYRPSSPDWNRAAFYRDRFRNDPSAVANQIGLASMLARQRRGRRPYGGKMASAIGRAVQKRYDVQQSQRGPKDSFLNWYLRGRTPMEMPRRQGGT